MLRALLLASVAGLPLAGPASASLITFDTRYSAAGPLASAEAYRSLIDGLAAAPATAGYGSTTLNSFTATSNQSVFRGSATNIAYRYTLDFVVEGHQVGTWNFRFGVDFGRGGALFLDGQAAAFRNTDLWWGGNWNATNQLLQVTRTLGAGAHRIVLYGLEGCCDGGFTGQFTAPGATAFTTFARTDGLRVSEPASLAVLGAGLLGLGLVKRRREIKA